MRYTTPRQTATTVTDRRTDGESTHDRNLELLTFATFAPMMALIVLILIMNTQVDAQNDARNDVQYPIIRDEAILLQRTIDDQQKAPSRASRATTVLEYRKAKDLLSDSKERLGLLCDRMDRMTAYINRNKARRAEFKGLCEPAIPGRPATGPISQ